MLMSRLGPGFRRRLMTGNFRLASVAARTAAGLPGSYEELAVAQAELSVVHREQRVDAAAVPQHADPAAGEPAGTRSSICSPRLADGMPGRGCGWQYPEV